MNVPWECVECKEEAHFSEEPTSLEHDFIYRGYDDGEIMVACPSCDETTTYVRPDETRIKTDD
jgi:hypothetical protein